MRETPGQDHLEAWCIELTLGGDITEETAGELLHRARLLDGDADRMLRVAAKVSAAKPARRQARLAKAAKAKARSVYLNLIAQVLHSTEKDVAGDLDYYEAHQARSSANAFGENWLKRQVAV